MNDFISNFDPFRGDIVYGTSGSRADYLEAFLKSYQKRFLERVKYGDQVRFSVYGTRGYYINDYNEPITNADFRDMQNLRLRSQRRFQDDYLNELNASKFTPHSVSGASWRELAKGNTQILRDFKQTPDADMTEARMALAVRRACKFGIDYVLRHKPGAQVHYILDGITMADVVSKSVMPLWTGKAGVPITTSELRFLFRYWNRFRNNQNFNFYLRYRKVRAPWESSPQPWVNYAVHRVNKYRLDYQRGAAYPLRRFDHAVAQNQHASAIRWFHAMPVNDAV